MNEDVIVPDYSKYVDPEIHNTLIITFRLRALCEIINGQPGLGAVVTRIEKTLGDVSVDVKSHSIKTMNLAKQMHYSAKAIAIGPTDIAKVLMFASKCKFTEHAPGGLTKSRLQITVRDDESPTRKYSEVLDVSTVKVLYSTATFAADIDIIPEISSTLSKPKLIANKQKIAEIMSLKSLALAEFIELATKAIPAKYSKEILTDVFMYANMRNKDGKLLVKARKAFEDNYKDNPGLISIFNTLVKGVL